jgi:hypothetical protein
MKKGKLREKFAIFCRTASAIRLEKVSNHHFKTNMEIQTCQQQSSLNKKITTSQSRNSANHRGKGKKVAANTK